MIFVKKKNTAERWKALPGLIITVSWLVAAKCQSVSRIAASVLVLEGIARRTMSSGRVMRKGCGGCVLICNIVAPVIL